MMATFYPRPSSFFCGNDEVFFFTCSTQGGDTSFSVPPSRAAEIEKAIASIGDIYSHASLASIREIASRALQISPDKVKLTHSVYYRHSTIWDSAIPIDESILSNKDIPRLDSELDPSHKSFELYRYLKSHKNFAVKVMDRRIVSFCFDNSNGTISIETNPEFRKNGYSKKCLAKVTRQICESKEYRHISYPTDIENIAACRAAERIGYSKHGEGLWVRAFMKLEDLKKALPDEDIKLVT